MSETVLAIVIFLALILLGGALSDSGADCTYTKTWSCQ